MPERDPRLYHLALREEWDEAVRGGADYRRSTLGVSLDQQGFIHCSFRSQVQGVADLAYRNRTDVILLAIDPSRVDAEIRVEDLTGAGTAFPHVYGPLPLGAVVGAETVPLGGDGRLDVAAALSSRP